jgi:hypothetical protein
VASDRSANELFAGIETSVVLCMENRSFDNVLGALRSVEGRNHIDGLTGAESNLDRRRCSDPRAPARRLHGVRSAGFAGCGRVLSEDLSHGHRFPLVAGQEMTMLG